MMQQQEQPNHLEDALALWEQGFSIIPLGDPFTPVPDYLIERNGGNIEEATKAWPKAPRIAWKQYQKEPPTRDQVMDWWTNRPTSNVAIITGNLVVVDADSNEAIRFIEESGQVSFSPWRVKTRRGKHYYFRANPDLPVKNSTGHQKIDLRGVGGYVAAPPSVAYDGTPYQQETLDGCNDDFQSLPIITHADISAIHSFNQSGKTHVNGSDPLNIDMAGVKLPATGEPVKKGTRNNTAASLVGQHIHQGMSLAEIQQAMRDWNAGNTDPLPAGELETTIASVTRTHTANHPDQPVPIAPLPPRNRGIDLSQWTADKFSGLPKERQWVIRDVLPQGVPAVVAATGDTGKSMMLLKLALQIATGEGGQFMGGDVDAAGTVVILTAEDDYDEVLRRVHAMDPANKRRHRPDRFRIVPLPDAGGPFSIVAQGQKGPEATKEYEHIRKQLLDIDNLRLVVFDPMQAFVAAEISSDTASGQFVASLAGSLAAETGATVVFTHHMRKANKPIESVSEARDAVRGTTALVDGVRCVIALWPDTEARAAKVCADLEVEFEHNRVVRGAVVKSNARTDRTIRTYVRTDTGLLEDRTHDIDDEKPAYDPVTKTYNGLSDEISDKVRSVAQIVVGEPGIMSGDLRLRITKLFQASDSTAMRLIEELKKTGFVTTEKEGRILKYYPVIDGEKA